MRSVARRRAVRLLPTWHSTTAIGVLESNYEDYEETRHLLECCSEFRPTHLQPNRQHRDKTHEQFERSSVDGWFKRV
jgi:hypothetical protein